MTRLWSRFEQAKKKVMTSEEVVKQLLSPIMPRRRKVLKPAPHVDTMMVTIFMGEDSLLFGECKMQ